MRRALPTFIFVFVMVPVFVFPALSAEYRHPKTGVSFSESVGEANLISVKDYEKEYPGLGTGIIYRSDSFKADVFIYDMGKGPIPAGVTSEVLTRNIEQAMGDVYTLEKRGSYKDLIVLIKKETVRIGGFPFLHSKMTFTQGDIKRVSHLYLTGYKDHFIKVRITYFFADIGKGEKSLAEFLNMFGNSLNAASK